MELTPAPRNAEPQLGPDAAPVIPPGYKQTEVGVIPEEWSIRRLDEFAELLSSKRIFESDYVPSGVPFYRGKEITELIENSPIGDECFISDTRYDEIRRKYGAPGKGDILITAVGTLGNVYCVPDDRPFYFKDGNVIWLRNINGIDGKYLSIQLTNRKDHIVGNAIGSSQKALTIVTLKQTFVPLPPTLAEQQAIAAALGDADAYIDALAQRIAKQRLVKQGAMQALLTGKRRLPGFVGEWEVRRLAELADIRSGGTPSTARHEFWDGDINWCTPTDVTSLDGGKYLTSTDRRITGAGLHNSSAEIIPPGSVVMTSRATIGECAINAIPLATNQGFKNFVVFENVDAEFLYYMLQTQKQNLVSLCSGSTFLEIGKTQLALFELRLPPTKIEQTAIAAVLSDMDAAIEALEAKLAKARLVKQGMMQELLTGRVRLV